MKLQYPYYFAGTHLMHSS